ncbi:sensor histidine kinase [Pseudonocardia saturnea]
MVGTSARLGAARRVRLRIAAGFGLLLLVTALVAAFAVREVLVIRLESRIENALGQEIAEFNRFLLVAADPQQGRPAPTLPEMFDAYLTRNVPSNEEAFVAFTGGEVYRASLSRFPLDRLPPDVVGRFTGTDQLAPPDDLPSGRFESGQGPGYYRALPVVLGATAGTFVVMILPTAEFAEIGEVQTYGALAVLVVLLLAATLAWALVRRLLGPVELLTETAEQISRSDLNRRIDVQGTGEAADMARTFNAMLDRIESVFRVEREFVRDASHELRVPVTVCMGNLEVLAIELGRDDDHAATIALVIDELGRMARIVDDLRLLADAGGGEFLQPESIDLAVLRDDLLAKAQVLGDRRWLAEGEPSGTLLADRHRLTEAVMNLADNAVRHTAPDSVIAIGADASAEEVRLWVRDTGPGVAPTDQARIFDRFRRGAGAYRAYRGSGLGLSIVRAVADAHGGRVVLDSTPGAGSTFTIVLPLVTETTSSWPSHPGLTPVGDTDKGSFIVR